MARLAVDVPARVPYGYADREQWLELDFPVEEFERRAAGIRRALEEEELEALILFGDHNIEANVRYVSGFFGLFGQSWVIVPRSGDPVLVTNAVLHGEPMHSNVQKTFLRDVRPVPHPTSTGTRMTPVDFVLDALEEFAPSGAVGLADANIPAPVYLELQDKLGSRLTPAPDILRRLRRIKSAAEIEVIRKLADSASAAMEAALDAVRPGVTEHEIAAAANHAAIASGADRVQFLLVVSGQRSFMKNVLPLEGKRVQPDELVEIDMNLKRGGYQADHARNTVAGTASREVREILDVCLEAHQAGLEATKPGALVMDIVKTMTDLIAEAGWAEWDWSTGHGFGLDLAEDPLFVPGNTEPLEEGMCFYIEPMIIPTHIGTACIEDMVLVTADGCEELTTSRKRVW
jgi:Xaa-Pro aminopeptidase